MGRRSEQPWNSHGAPDRGANGLSPCLCGPRCLSEKDTALTWLNFGSDRTSRVSELRDSSNRSLSGDRRCPCARARMEREMGQAPSTSALGPGIIHSPVRRDDEGSGAGKHGLGVGARFGEDFISSAFRGLGIIDGKRDQPVVDVPRSTIAQPIVLPDRKGDTARFPWPMTCGTVTSRRSSSTVPELTGRL